MRKASVSVALSIVVSSMAAPAAFSEVGVDQKPDPLVFHYQRDEEGLLLSQVWAADCSSPSACSIELTDRSFLTLQDLPAEALVYRLTNPVRKGKLRALKETADPRAWLQDLPWIARDSKAGVLALVKPGEKGELETLLFSVEQPPLSVRTLHVVSTTAESKQLSPPIARLLDALSAGSIGGWKVEADRDLRRVYYSEALGRQVTINKVFEDLSIPKSLMVNGNYLNGVVIEKQDDHRFIVDVGSRLVPIQVTEHTGYLLWTRKPHRAGFKWDDFDRIPSPRALPDQIELMDYVTIHLEMSPLPSAGEGTWQRDGEYFLARWVQMFDKPGTGCHAQ